MPFGPLENHTAVPIISVLWFIDVQRLSQSILQAQSSPYELLHSAFCRSAIVFKAVLFDILLMDICTCFYLLSTV